MGSGVNRKWWAEKGTRTSRRSGTKTRNRAAAPSRLRMKRDRAEAARRSQEGMA